MPDESEISNLARSQEDPEMGVERTAVAIAQKESKKLAGRYGVLTSQAIRRFALTEVGVRDIKESR